MRPTIPTHRMSPMRADRRGHTVPPLQRSQGAGVRRGVHELSAWQEGLEGSQLPLRFTYVVSSDGASGAGASGSGASGSGASVPEPIPSPASAPECRRPAAP